MPIAETIPNTTTLTLSDKDILSCNDNLLNKSYEWEATQIWKFGEEIGILGKGNNGEIIAKLAEMEERDKKGKPCIP